MFNIPVNFGDLKKADFILESSLDVHRSLDTFFLIYQLLEFEDDFQVVSQFSCLLGHHVFPRIEGIQYMLSTLS